MEMKRGQRESSDFDGAGVLPESRGRDIDRSGVRISNVQVNRGVQYRHPRLAETIARELRDAILSGVYSDGDYLPKQDDLVEQFGVSAPSIREALRVLETEGLVTVQRGNVGGALVHTPRAGKIAYMLGLMLQHQSVLIRDIADTLARLDPACAALCAELPSRKRTVVPLLRANLRESKKAIRDPKLYTPLAHTFHEIMVNNCGSPTTSLVIGALESLWTGHVAWLTGPGRSHASQSTTTLEARQVSWEEHSALIDLIVIGDAEGAERLAHQHLTSHEDLAYPFSLDTVVVADTVRDVRD
jgi:GntR family transcriptional repressor for pyruvate dehydrogenase complex